MVHPAVFAVATGIGLLTDKYMLEVTNYVEHYALDMRPTDEQESFIKSAMYAGAIIGMVTFGPISDFAGRRACLIACSVITLLGAACSAGAYDSNSLIVARIITGIGMGGEYPLAAAHSAEAASDSNNGARNVALLYLFGSGGGPVLAALACYLLDLSGMEGEMIWRALFFIGVLLALSGLILRVLTTENSKKFCNFNECKPPGTRRNFLRHYWRPLLGTSLAWLLFDFLEYGLKQNDAAIFAVHAADCFRTSVLMVFSTRLLCGLIVVIPALILAPWLLTKLPSKYVQMIGLMGCTLANLTLAVGYDRFSDLPVLFGALYVTQLSFQSLPGVTTLAIPAEIFPSAVRGTGSAISAASGKVGATVGSFLFTMLKEKELFHTIFWVVTGTAVLALLLTVLTTPLYNGRGLDEAERLACTGETEEAVRALYRGIAPPDEDAAEMKQEQV
jgi:PHS family inorganic phosphate transporter-like MFS transporter